MSAAPATTTIASTLDDQPMMQGYGAMGLSAFYGSSAKVTDEKAIEVVTHAVKSGATLINTATFYGPLNEQGYGANLRLLAKCLKNTDRSKYQLMVKVGMDTKAPVEKTGSQFIMRGDAASLREDVEYALKQLETEDIDIIVLCRVPNDVPIEDSIQAMAELVKEGKARHIGLSEASAKTIRKAHAVHPIYALEQEWSMWARDCEEDLIPTCRELGIRIVAYSPLGRGFLTGTIRGRDSNVFGEHDFRLMGVPRFSEENLPHNLELVDQVAALAQEKGITVGQLALAWLHAQGSDVIPIPGTTSVAHLDDNLAALNIKLTEEEKKRIDDIFHIDAVKGDRYAHSSLTHKGN
jgi:aryl-alcohol dehydrogenase-like predicted oxidoreductase